MFIVRVDKIKCEAILVGLWVELLFFLFCEALATIVNFLQSIKG